jgi:putative SOS response-associated peptidase YedK
MCNNYDNDPTLIEWAEKFRTFLGLLLTMPAGAAEGTSNLTYKSGMWPKYQGLFVRAADPLAPAAGLEPAVGRWGVVPWFHKGPAKAWQKSTNNARSENLDGGMWRDLATAKDGHPPKRCIIPATRFMEHTGPRGSMTKHKITRADGGPLFVAGLWGSHTWEGEVTESYTMVMQDVRPGDDMAPFHNRQPVFLGQETARIWLDPAGDYHQVLASPPAGTLAFDPPTPAAA